MPDEVLDQGTIAFQAEGRLLQELGERLVASPEVALVELIKNSFDADSPSCEVRIIKEGPALVIADHGHGMTLEEFAGKWMRIATSSKLEDRVSRSYKRRLTGAKGIGRFAVRYLGDSLTLISIAEDKKRRSKTKLTARFDWPTLDKFENIKDAIVPYMLERVSDRVPTGTALEVRNLKTSTDFTSESSLRAEVLRIVTPLQGFDGGKFTRAHRPSGKDPGFQVTLPEEASGNGEGIDLAALVLDNYWARLQIEHSGGKLTFKTSFPSAREPKVLEIETRSSISSGFVADIRYFPRRKGVFRGKGINGKVAWQWVRDNSGIAVVDRGFRIVPYGYEFDDWLHLDYDKAHSARDWRTEIAKEYFPIPGALRNRPSENPALYLPYNYQLVGAVFVESAKSLRPRAVDLVPAMDREGFLKNDAYEELVGFVRAGIEFLALQDKRELGRILDREAREASKGAKEDVRRAIDFIKKSPTLSAPDKARLTKVYRQLADRIENVEEYNAQARRSLVTMSLLGVVAGFMTHETKSLVFEMEKVSTLVSSLAKKHPSLTESGDQIAKRLSAFKGQLQYAQMFLKGVQRNEATVMSASGQIRHVVKRFETFAIDHNIDVTWDAPSNVLTPALPPAVYSGVLLNLYTNALKAVLSVNSSIRNPKIAIRSWNEGGQHFVEVSDNGVGVPPEMRKRIWDPLYTTTSDDGNPLGSGMGLGLTLVKQVVEDVGGRISLEEHPPPGFGTCFRVVFTTK